MLLINFGWTIPSLSLYMCSTVGVRGRGKMFLVAPLYPHSHILLEGPIFLHFRRFVSSSKVFSGFLRGITFSFRSDVVGVCMSVFLSVFLSVGMCGCVCVCVCVCERESVCVWVCVCGSWVLEEDC